MGSRDDRAGQPKPSPLSSQVLEVGIEMAETWLH